MSQLGTSSFQQWIVDAIEKEKMKKNHLQGVITHLESEVAGLSKETVEQMKENMKEVRQGKKKGSRGGGGGGGASRIGRGGEKREFECAEGCLLGL